MGFFKDLEIEEVDPNYVDPNQLKLIPDEGAESRSMAPTASSQSLDSALTASDVPSFAYMPRGTSAAPGAGITNPGRPTVKDVRYIEEFLSKRFKVG